MKDFRRSLLATVAMCCGYVAIPAHADTVNIPFSDGLPSNEPGIVCTMGTAFTSYSPLPAVCTVDFPVVVPVGRTVTQISVVHGAGLLYPDPFITASLKMMKLAPPYTEDTYFPWSHSGFTNGDILTSQMMRHIFGQNESFLMSSQIMYHVVVTVQEGASVYGLQITYN